MMRERFLLPKGMMALAALLFLGFFYDQILLGGEEGRPAGESLAKKGSGSKEVSTPAKRNGDSPAVKKVVTSKSKSGSGAARSPAKGGGSPSDQGPIDLAQNVPSQEKGGAADSAGDADSAPGGEPAPEEEKGATAGGTPLPAGKTAALPSTPATPGGAGKPTGSLPSGAKKTIAPALPTTRNGKVEKPAPSPVGPTPPASPGKDGKVPGQGAGEKNGDKKGGGGQQAGSSLDKNVPQGPQAQGAQAPGAGQVGPGRPQVPGAKPPPAGGQAAGAPAPKLGAQGGQPEEGTFIPPEPSRLGKKANISEGKINLVDFLKFLADYTGLPLLCKSDDPSIQGQKDITIAYDIEGADEDLVKAILEINGYRVYRETLASGREVLKVEAIQAAQPTMDDPKEMKIYKPGTEIEIQPDEFATMVFTLKYTAPRDASEALNSLVIKAPGGGPAGAPGAIRGSKSFSMVEVKNTMMLIITAKFGLLNYIRKLLELIDVPIQEPERIIHIIEVQEADPADLVSIIEEFLQQGQGASRGGFGSRGGLTSRSRLRQLGQTVPPTTPGAGGQTSSLTGAQNEYQTRLIPDARTNKIIIETYFEQDLQDILMLVNELDIRFDLRRLRTHIYHVRYLKATEVASDLQALLAGSGGGTLGGLRRQGVTGGTSRTSRTSTARQGIPRVGATGGQPGTVTQPGTGGQNAPQPSLIVPHEPTNSLLIQAEPEEYDEILNILSKIDTKRRQVFLEAALVQVKSQSALNYTIELLAGNPDDQATRALFASSFGLTGIDFENFSRIAPTEAPMGGLLAIMNRGKLPAIITFFKTNSDSQILATPFVLADDNMENNIDISETRYVATTNTGANQITSTSQQAEESGIKLGLTPTISGSERAVFLQLDMEVSDFDDSRPASEGSLPPKVSNILASSVTIPDGEVFVVGGLTRQGKSKSVSKLPILGDIPIIGKLFRSEATGQSQNNLYIFLQAHILTDEEFQDGLDLTRQAGKKVKAFDPTIETVQFKKPEIEKRSKPADDSDRTFNLNPSKEGTARNRYGSRSSSSGKIRFSTRENIGESGASRYDGGEREEATPAGEGPQGPPRSMTESAPRPERTSAEKGAARSPAQAPASAEAKKRPPSRTGTGAMTGAREVADHDGWLLAPVPGSRQEESREGWEE